MAVGGATGCVATAGVVKQSARRALYPRRQGPDIRLGHDLEVIRTHGDHPTYALFGAATGAMTAVYLHGNGTPVGGSLGTLRALSDRGFGVAAVEYPGYGPSPGRPTEASITASVLGALDYLTERCDVHPAQILLVGRSLGCAVAIAVAARGYGSRMVLAAPFTSAADVFRAHCSWLPARLMLSSERWDSLATAARVTVPTRVLHGTEDEVIPFRMGEDLAAALPHAELVALPGKGHDDISPEEIAQACVAIADTA
ncbi:MAG: alpha/beta hydrolase [Nocardioidaceae bacterium]